MLLFPSHLQILAHEVDQADQADQPETVARTAAGTLRSTRAGGQDDVSSQANSLKREHMEIVETINILEHNETYNQLIRNKTT